MTNTTRWDAEIELILTDPDSKLSPGAVRALEYVRSHLATTASATVGAVEPEISEFVCDDCGTPLRIGSVCHKCGCFAASTPEEFAEKTADMASRVLPQSVLDALRFYANGEHLVIDGEAQEFDTVSGEPQNWLMSHKDGDTTMLEDGSIARQALMGGELTWSDEDDDCIPKPIKGEVFAAIASKGAQG